MSDAAASLKDLGFYVAYARGAIDRPDASAGIVVVVMREVVAELALIASTRLRSEEMERESLAPRVARDAARLTRWQREGAHTLLRAAQLELFEIANARSRTA